MDENKLRQLERQYKLRVKTGCETCRRRRVKCDETKPECQRCTKSGRKCEGYKHAAKSRDQSPAVAASFRNPSFLVVPQRSQPTSVPRNPSRSLSPESAENRSFFYFQRHTLPQWTEFFDSDLWSQKILQLSHFEPAIKHGVLALSTLHERFENTDPIFSTGNNDFAFVQYMQAVKHSNDLLTAHREGRVDVEKILIACIIFTCYENLAGNYRAANMHLRNGIRILNQHQQDALQHPERMQVPESIANALYRFDLQAMTFSDNASPYDYNIDSPPKCPEIPPAYQSVSDARNGIVGLLRCMMWISGIANIHPRAPEHPIWLSLYDQLMIAFEAWQHAFAQYQHQTQKQTQADAKVLAGNTLVKMYAIMARTIVAAGSDMKSELSWDSFASSFKTIVDLADNLQNTVTPASPVRSRSSSGSSTPPPQISPAPSPFQPARSIAPQLGTPSPPPCSSTFALPTEMTHKHTPSRKTGATSPTSAPKTRPPAFTPSFELTPIVPLFVTVCRCRDPVVRRRAMALLLSCRRREGVWDSYGAAMVALQIIKLEEGIGEMVELDPDNWLPLNPKIKEAKDVPEASRVQDVFVSVNMAERKVGCNYLMQRGESLDRYVKF